MKEVLPEQSLLSPPPTSHKKKLLSFGALGISVLFHSTLFLLIGGVVLIEGVIPRDLFTASPEVADSHSETVVESQPEPEAQPESSGLPEEMAADPASSPIDPLANTPSQNLIATETVSHLQTVVAAPMGSSIAGFGTGMAGTKGTGSGEGGKGFKTMGNPFGSKGTLDGGLVGYFYDLKQTTDGKPTEFANTPGETISSNAAINVKFGGVVRNFIKNWNPSVLKEYYQAKEPLTTYQFFMPTVTADSAPKAFDVDKFVQPRRWLIHYKGTVVAPKTGTFRFVGLGDDVLIVRFNNREVIDASWTIIDGSFNAPEMYGKAFASSTQNIRIGKWISVVEGQSYPMEVLIGEVPGGKFSCYLLAEEKDGKYENRPNGVKGPRLPVFQTAPTQIPRYKAEEDAPAVTNEGWVFSGNP